MDANTHTAQYLTMAEAATYLRMPSPRALTVFRSRYGVPQGIKVGRRLLFTRKQLDDAIADFHEEKPRPARIRVR